MKYIKCRKCRRHFLVTDNDYCLSKCTGCGSTDFEEIIYTLPESNLNWEQIRVDATIAAIPAAINKYTIISLTLFMTFYPFITIRK